MISYRILQNLHRPSPIKTDGKTNWLATIIKAGIERAASCYHHYHLCPTIAPYNEWTRRHSIERIVTSATLYDTIREKTRDHHCRVAGEGHRVVAPPCPRSTARLQSSPIGRVESFRSWSSHLFRGRPCGRRHVRSGGRLSDTLMWSWRAMFAGESSSSRATCPNTEMRRPSTR